VLVIRSGDLGVGPSSKSLGHRRLGSHDQELLVNARRIESAQKKFLKILFTTHEARGILFLVNNKFFSYSSGNHGKFLKVFGLTLALNPWGNCFSPAICLATNLKAKPFNFKGKLSHPAKLTLTFRSSISLETTIYWRGGLRFDWNSAHLARRFGTFVVTDFGGYSRWHGHVDL